MRRDLLPWIGLVSVFVANSGCGENAYLDPVSTVAIAAPSSAGALSARPAGADWPWFRGPQGNGISQDKNWNDEWNGDGPKKLWEGNVGVGFSSFAVVGDKVYTMGHTGDDDTVYCLDAASGKEIWKHSYPCKLVDNLHEGGPAATPTVDGDRVYTLSKEGQLFCLNAASGDVVWKQQLAELLEVAMPAWGFSSSPMVFGEKLIVEAGRTCAFDKKTGELVWKTEKYKPGYGSPALFQPGDEPLVAVLNNEFLLVVRAADGSEVGKIKWETPFETSASTPIVSENTLFISTGYKRGCMLAALADGKLSRVYENKEMRNHMANCVLLEGVLYGIDGQSNEQRRCKLKAMDHKTGEIKWEQEGFGCGTVLAADGKLIVLSDEGEIATAQATPEGYKQISRGRALEGKCWTLPVLAGGRIFCRNANGNVVCLDVSN